LFAFDGYLFLQPKRGFVGSPAKAPAVRSRAPPRNERLMFTIFMDCSLVYFTG
jgi:hypothetical protein